MLECQLLNTGCRSGKVFSQHTVRISKPNLLVVALNSDLGSLVAAAFIRDITARVRGGGAESRAATAQSCCLWKRFTFQGKTASWMFTRGGQDLAAGLRIVKRFGEKDATQRGLSGTWQLERQSMRQQTRQQRRTGRKERVKRERACLSLNGEIKMHTI